MAIPLTPEQAAALEGVRAGRRGITRPDEITRVDDISRVDDLVRVDEVVADIAVNEEVVAEGVRGGIRAGVRGGIRAAEAGGVRGGVRGASARFPSTVYRLLSTRRQIAEPPALAFEVVFALPGQYAVAGEYPLMARLRSAAQPDVGYVQVKTTLKVKGTQDAGRTTQGEGEEGADQERGTRNEELGFVIAIEETPIEVRDVELPDDDQDGIATLVEVATVLALSDAEGPAALEQALSAATNRESRVTSNDVQIAFGRLTEALDSTLQKQGVETPITLAAIDLTPPDTALSAVSGALPVASGASIKSGQEITLTFSCSDTSNELCFFRCSLDGAPFSPCSSPAAYRPPHGDHVLAVRAVDAMGNTDPTPASFTFKVVSTFGPNDHLPRGQMMEAKVSSKGAAVAADAGKAKLVFPPGAVTQELSVKIKKLDPVSTPVPPGSHGEVYEFGPEGTVFKAPVEMTLAYQETDVPKDSLEGQLTLATEVSGSWQVIPGSGVDVALNEVKGPATHFSRFTIITDTTPPLAPDPAKLTVAMNPPGTADTIQGSSGSVEAGSSVRIYSDGLVTSLIAQTSSLADGSFPAVSVGDNANATVYITATDGAGNQSAVTIMTNDITPPDTTLVGAGLPALLTNQTSASFSFSCSDVGATSTSPACSFECSLDSASFSSCSSPTTLNSQLGGAHTFSVRALDAASNPDPTPASYTWTVETTPPSAGAVTPSNAATATHVDSPFDLSATFADTAGVISCEHCKSTDGTCDTEWAAGTWGAGTCSVTALACTDGQTLTLNMRATDGVGNVGTASTVTRTCDTAGSTCSVSSITEGTNPGDQHVSGATLYYRNAGAGNFTVNVTASDGGSGVQKLVFPTTVSAGGEDTSSPYSLAYSWTTSSTFDGSAAITAHDNVGNTGTCSFTVTLDTMAPSGGSVSITDGWYNTASVPVTFVNGTDASSGLGQRLLQRRSATLSSGACGTYGSYTTIATDPSSSPYNDTTVANGNCYQYQFVVNDNVGNANTYSSASTARVDTAAPTFGGVTSATAVSASQIDLSWTAATDTVSVQANIVYEICQTTTSGGCLTFTATYTTTAGATSYPVVTLSPGTRYYFVVRAKDEANNVDANTVENSTVTWGQNIIQAVAVGGTLTCALIANGTVKCWGRNDYGQLGDGTTVDKSTPVAVSTLTSAVAITGGNLHTCALVSGGTVKCWGYNNNGQLGDGTKGPTADKSTPVAVSTLTGAIAITGGWGHTCALVSDGTVKCWGANYYGQLGDGTTGPTADKSTPVAVSTLTGAIAITGGDYHTCALVSDGTGKCWGDNVYGELGDGTLVDKSTPVAVSTFTGAVAITGGNGHTCALVSDGTGKCWGKNLNGQLGDGTTANRLAPIAVSFLSSAAAIAGGSAHTCSLLSDGTVKCWGYNAYGELGDGTTADKTTPVAVSMPAGPMGIKLPRLHESTASGAPARPFREGLTAHLGSHTCSLLSDGTVKCWGSNWQNQLGDGTAADRSTPVAVSTLTNAVAVTGGEYHTCSLLSNGTVKCWGPNGYGQLGDGTVANKSTPVAVSTLTSAVAIAGGFYHTCSLLADGSVNCWGYNANGQLGDGSNAGKSTPVAVSTLTNAVAIATGGRHTCSLLSDGTVKCWGYAVLGDGTWVDKTTPVAVSTLTNAVAVAGGSNHTCSLSADGGIKCWGFNDFGQLGDGTTTDKSTPVAVSTLTNAVAVTGGNLHTCSLLSDGSVRCWGNNPFGQLGDGTTTDKWAPVVVSTVTAAVAVAGGQVHTCVLLSDGSVKCWGNNANGRLGDGTTASKSTPVQVLYLP
ncbi:MAG: hypothetical protein HYT87_10170 [Nitrospirae bacterium]|nr:hypothetical protein [Nitrospirota bacterium]